MDTISAAATTTTLGLVVSVVGLTGVTATGVDAPPAGLPGLPWSALLAGLMVCVTAGGTQVPGSDLVADSHGRVNVVGEGAVHPGSLAPMTTVRVGKMLVVVHSGEARLSGNASVSATIE